MTAKDAIEIGRHIAARHMVHVMECGRLNGSSESELKQIYHALNGCEVDLASQIIGALGRAE